MPLVLSLMTLVLLIPLMLAFLSMATSESLIAHNHMRSTQARALAESGVEMALHKLSTDEPASLTWASGGVSVTVEPGAVPHERLLVARGEVAPATRAIRATATRVPFLDPPCAACGVASVGVGPAARIDASQASQYCSGVLPTATVMTPGPVSVIGSPTILAPPGGVSIWTNAAPFAFLLSDADLDLLRALAKERGTHYASSQVFTTAPAAGLVVVDGDAEARWPGAWSGWLIVTGRAVVGGNLVGLVYAGGDLTVQESATVHGGALAGGHLVSEGQVDYSCPAMRDGGGTISQRWFVRPGTFREASE